MKGCGEMYLTDEEKEFLTVKKAKSHKKYAVLVEYGEAAGAERLLDLGNTVDLHPLADWVPKHAVTLMK